MTTPVDYDRVAPAYDRRYEARRFEGLEATIRDFVAATPGAQVVVEVGCGTAHWLAQLDRTVRRRIGVDPSAGMLTSARANAPGALLVQAGAERLPLRDRSADAVLCINAYHHFTDRARFVAEARRVLRPGGGALIVGLDPQADPGRWWIYETFPSALRLDRERYPSAVEIRALLQAAGFAECATGVAEEIHGDMPFADALEQGLLDRRSTSQLMVIADAEYDDGLRHLHATRPVLHADLRLYATTGRAT